MTSKNARRKARRKDLRPPKVDGAEVKNTGGVVLCMIVKNESKIIHRCLDSAKPAISGVCVTDTGSEDNTIELIEQWGRDNDLPTKVCKSPFKNFGYARSRSFINAKAHFPDASYYLLLDADMVLVVTEFWDPSQLTDHCYSVYQFNTSIRYTNIRLIRADRKWRCRAATHEFWECEDATSSDVKGTCRTIEIDDRNDGGAKADKFTRDKRLLLAELAEKDLREDIRTRDMFYLAQTYNCLGEHKEAIRRYQARIKRGGFEEEAWYCHFQIGEMYKELDNWENALHWYELAWNRRSHRTEPLQRIAKYYREKEHHKLALHWAKLGISLGYPHDDHLFIEHWVYDWGLKLEVEICGYYVPPERNLGYQIHRDLTNMRDDVIPGWVRRILEKNSEFYLM